MASVGKFHSHVTFWRAFFKQSIKLYYVALLLLSASKQASATYGEEADRSALLAIKHQINDDLLSWNGSVHHCRWEGITCSLGDTGRVTGLDLQNRKLQGTLSAYIGNITFLTIINLNENAFNGAIPQEIGRLVHLQELSLSNNSFSGEIPKNITRCSELRLLNLIDNKLNGKILSELSSLSKLERLSLARNGFSGNIPSSFGNLSFLSHISLKMNYLEGTIPHNLCFLSRLAIFQVSANNLTGTIPLCFYNNSEIKRFAVAQNEFEGNLPLHFGLGLPNIREIYLGSNNFVGIIPISITNASNLELIDFHGNFFTGSLPRNLGSLQNLTDLNFDKNQLGIGTEGGDNMEFLASLVNCTNLRTIDFEQNFLKGPLPESISNLSIKLTRLNAMGNRISGIIPEDIRNLINIESILLQENSLTGNIPLEIGNLPKLVEINLQGNLFSGQIPLTLGNLTQLTILNLGDNSLSGTIPLTLEHCRNLRVLNLSHNQLLGTIPRQVIGHSSLVNILSLQHNFLTGSFILESGSLSNVVTLDISHNKLSGPIPESLGNCLSLVDLYLDSNFFEGQIPLSMKGLRGLENLDLSHNKLSGGIPEFFESFPLLKLNLSFNQLQGPIPKKGVFENTTAVSVVGNKNLCGGIIQLQLPPCIGTNKRSSFSPKVVIWVTVGSLGLLGLLCLFLVYYRKRLFNTPSEVSTTWLKHLYKVSYVELLIATNGFSATSFVGSGSYGSVYKGNLPEMNKAVAVKVLNLNRQGAFKSFLTECNAMRNIRHRNLLTLITACSSMDYQGNDFKALVFDFMHNGSLEDWLVDKGNLATRKLSFIQRLNIAIDIASALEYLHHHFETPVVHCDLKPSNILLNEDMVAHVADFGIAKIISSTSFDALGSQLSSVSIKGSVGYVAPEYVMSVNVSTQGDVYSYGILLLEMFTRKKPTDDIFVDGLCLHNYVEMALGNHVMQIADPTMLLEETVITFDNLSVDNAKERMQACLASLLRLGVSCSFESAAKRSTMTEVIHELHRIKDYYQFQEVFGDGLARVTVF
ncbi:non-specific serine/threonine protein kinase [Ranunculus cassubicifolius]